MQSNTNKFSVYEPAPELLAAAVQSSQDAIITCNPDGIITSWNTGAVALTGHRAEDVVNTHVSVIVPPALVDEANAAIAEMLSGRHYHHFESRIIKADGTGLRVSVTLSPIISGGQQIGVSFIIRDAYTACKTREPDMEEVNEILEKRVAERTAELQEANSALEAFSYSVSHDLKAPVRAINNFAKLISRECSQQLPPDAIELLGHIESNSRRLNCIIEDLLSLARFNKGVVNFTSVHTDTLFTKVWDNLKRTMPNSAAMQITGDLPAVYADASMIEQVVVNLLSNAIKYSAQKEKPMVKVGSRNMNGSLVFYVKDNGAGFDMQYYDRLFGVFERLHSASEFEGTGVGLYLVKRILEKHGGRIWANAIVGEGAEFCFTLPIKSNN
jgi:PAS domain S-box-containing protein